MGSKFCKENGDMLFYEVSAKNNMNVELAFQALIKRVIKRQEDMNKILGSDAGKGSSG